MNPVIMTILFFVVFTPIGFIARVMGKDPMGLKPARELKSHWRMRQPPGPEPKTMSNQF